MVAAANPPPAKPGLLHPEIFIWSFNKTHTSMAGSPFPQGNRGRETIRVPQITKPQVLPLPSSKSVLLLIR
jgi:hypothetical protein